MVEMRFCCFCFFNSYAYLYMLFNYGVSVIFVFYGLIFPLSQDRIILASPVQAMKAVKNPTEIANSELSHVSVAHSHTKYS